MYELCPRDPGSPCHRMKKKGGVRCPSSPPKRKTLSFHETILSSKNRQKSLGSSQKNPEASNLYICIYVLLCTKIRYMKIYNFWYTISHCFNQTIKFQPRAIWISTRIRSCKEVRPPELPRILVTTRTCATFVFRPVVKLPKPLWRFFSRSSKSSFSKSCFSCWHLKLSSRRTARIEDLHIWI